MRKNNTMRTTINRGRICARFLPMTAITHVIVLLTASTLVCGPLAAQNKKPTLPNRPYVLDFNLHSEPRRARIYPPVSVDRPAPAVIYFHGRGGTAQDSERRRRFHELWPEAWIVYAEGTDFSPDSSTARGWEIRFPHVYTHCKRKKDFDYVELILEHLAATRLVDDRKLFAAGHSSGGFFTLSLMEIMPVFRAYAAASCYSQYDPNLKKIDCDNTYHYVPFNTALRRGVRPAAKPSPVLYLFGMKDTDFDREGSDVLGVPGYDRDVDTFSHSNKTLIELTSRNRARVPTGTRYMTTTSVQRFPARSPSGAEVRFKLYLNKTPGSRGHSWPDGGNEWVVDYFKSQVSPRRLGPGAVKVPSTRD